MMLWEVRVLLKTEGLSGSHHRSPRMTHAPPSDRSAKAPVGGRKGRRGPEAGVRGWSS